eukprot:3910178-Pyramimonas_sp.AAC.1
MVTSRIKWNYEAPKEDANMLKVPIYIDPCSQWEVVHVYNMADLTSGKLCTTVLDLKRIIMAGFEDIVVGKISLKVDTWMVEVKMCSGSCPVGSELKDTDAVYDGKWYYVTCNNLLSELRKMDSDETKVKAANEDVQ